MVFMLGYQVEHFECNVISRKCHLNGLPYALCLSLSPRFFNQPSKGGGNATCLSPGNRAEDPPNDLIELINNDKTSNQQAGFLKALVRS